MIVRRGQVAKANHAVLFCRMEQHEITSWFETDKFGLIPRANAQDMLLLVIKQNSNQKFKTNWLTRKLLNLCRECTSVTLLAIFQNFRR